MSAETLPSQLHLVLWEAAGWGLRRQGFRPLDLRAQQLLQCQLESPLPQRPHDYHIPAAAAEDWYETSLTDALCKQKLDRGACLCQCRCLCISHWWTAACTCKAQHSSPLFACMDTALTLHRKCNAKLSTEHMGWHAEGRQHPGVKCARWPARCTMVRQAKQLRSRKHVHAHAAGRWP